MEWTSRTSRWEIDIVCAEAILYKRRQMHNDDAGMPTPAPSRSFVAR